MGLSDLPISATFNFFYCVTDVAFRLLCALIYYVPKHKHALSIPCALPYPEVHLVISSPTIPLA